MVNFRRARIGLGSWGRSARAATVRHSEDYKEEIDESARKHFTALVEKIKEKDLKGAEETFKGVSNHEDRAVARVVMAKILCEFYTRKLRGGFAAEGKENFLLSDYISEAGIRRRFTAKIHSLYNDYLLKENSSVPTLGAKKNLWIRKILDGQEDARQERQEERLKEGQEIYER